MTRELSTDKSKPQDEYPQDILSVSKRNKSFSCWRLAVAVTVAGGTFFFFPGKTMLPGRINAFPLQHLEHDVISSTSAASDKASGQTVFSASSVVSSLATPASAAPAPAVTDYNYRIVHTYPHDPGAFTQGLSFAGGRLYEGTGHEGSSSVRRVELTTGRILQEQRLDRRYFGEGITVWKDRIIQLTWRSRIGLVYDRTSFRLRGSFRYDHEGWGITHDGRRFLVSDGSHILRFYDPETLRETGRLQIRDEYGGLISGLNELEYVRGMIYANVWPTDVIAIIDPRTGRLRGRINLSGLLPAAASRHGVDVLNGIAYDATGDRLFVTGKYWPLLFEIKLVKK